MPPPTGLEIAIALFVSHVLDRVPQPMRSALVRAVARLVARLPGGAWPAVIICSFEFEL